MRCEPGEYGIVLGTELAKALGVALGERVVIVTSLRTTTPAGRHAAHARASRSSALFSAGMYEFDRNLAYVHIADAARLYRMGEDVTGLRLKLADMFAAPRVVRELASRSAAATTSTTGRASTRISSARSS